ncbi:assimilatory nitrite reductase (NAD(P)H) small subunit [Agromyces sp. CF514]|uniref:nitrite reductase small subunit NirD n=1 Tax=Agromyces sp. CF514 TaxID=1881031 RepID=UPI0008EF1D38|nr:nitrite reductase small subunit NirD [Agromyces sp. CF514]SFR75523.1 assimilatory nitrite reductase (NAD(P)H) small subunit [Agromyces sp. CF514]
MTITIEPTSDTSTDGTSAVATGASWVRVCEIGDLEPGWGEVALLGADQVALVRLGDDEVYAVDHHDPHTGAPVMARGITGSRGDRLTIASPLHKEVYDLVTGECYTNETLALRTFASRVVDGVVEVEVRAAA